MGETTRERDNERETETMRVRDNERVREAKSVSKWCVRETTRE